MSAALEGMQRALQGVGHRLRKTLCAIGQKTDQSGQVRLCFVTKYLQQLRVQRIFVLRQGSLLWHLISRSRLLVRRKRQRDGLSFGQRVRGSSQAVDIIPLALILGCELLNQSRHQGDNLVHHMANRVGDFDAAIQDPIEQVFHGPGELPDNQRPDHPTTAFEGMECTANFGQRILVLIITEPTRQVLADGLQDFGGFLDEDLEQVFIDRLLIGRRRQQSRGNVLRRWVDCRDRRRHDLFDAQRRLDLGALDRLGLGIIGERNLGQIEVGHLRLAPLLQSGFVVDGVRYIVGDCLAGVFGQAENDLLVGKRVAAEQVEVF